MDENAFYEGTHKVLYSFQQKGELCDVVLKGNSSEEKIYAHKVVLAVRSSFFKAMFTSDMKENQSCEVFLESITTNALRKIIKFCYVGEITLIPSDVESILAGAHMLALYPIQKECFAFLRNNIDASNSFGIAYLADTYGCDELKQIAEDYRLRNFRFIMASPDFQMLSYEHLVRLISHNNLNVLCEGEVYEAVLKWVKHDANKRKVFLKDLLSHIRFPMLTRKFLIDKITKEELIISDSGCREYLYNALDYHLVPERRLLSNQTKCAPRVSFSSAIYVIGGENRTGSLDSVEKFDLTTKTWDECAPLRMSRKYPAVVLLNGIIICVGGIDDTGRDLTCVEKYDPAQNQWVSLASLRTCQGAMCAAVLDGWLYALGGSSGGSSLKCVERYDPVKDEWTPVQQMKFPRSHFAVGMLKNKLYAIGGYCSIGDVAHCETYDPLTNKWLDLADLNKSRMNHGVAVCGEKIFVVGGLGSNGILDCIEKYNRGLNMWLIIKHTLDPRTGASILLANSENNDHWLFIIGGIGGSNCYHNSVKKVNLKSIEYSIECGKSMKEPRAYGAAIAF